MAHDLLSTNVDSLFENKNLEEVQQHLRKMRQEVEKKREELRVTVGSRYRDLIEAADTISDMKKTSEEVMDHLVSVEGLLSSLKHRQLLGFQTGSYLPDRASIEARKEYRALAAQVKLLMELPEMIWKQLETGSYSSAAQIQQLGFHLHTGLSVESGSGKEVQTWFPVVHRQKVALTSFNEIIIKESTNQLKSVQLTISKAGDSGCALVLLRGDSSSSLLTDFLKLRTEAMKSITKSQATVKQQLQQFLQFIVSSMAALHALFVEGFPDSKLPQGLLTEELKNLSQSSSISTIQLLPSTFGALIKHLPPIITEFRPSLNKTWTPLPLSEIRQQCQVWFEAVRLWIPQEFQKLLSCVTHIKTLANLREEAFTTLQAEPFANHWSELTQRLLGSNVSLWGELIQLTVVEKIENIIQNHLDTSLNGVRQSILTTCSKFDLKPWLWTEMPSDLPSSIIAPPNTSGVFMKTRCYTPSIQQLCSQWDQKLAVLREDLAHYQTAKTEATLPFDKLEMKAQIYSALENRCVDSVQKLVAFLNEEMDLSDNRVVFAMKFVSAVSDLCPQLRLCTDNENNGEGRSWISLTEFLRSSSLSLFHSWKKDLLTRMAKQFASQLQMKRIAGALPATSMWNEITIQEEAESGDAVQSQIRVPMNPSFALQQVLFKVCQEVNQVGPHSISKKAQVCLMEDTASAIVKCYEDYVHDEPSEIVQAVALQLLFDIRFICALLVARDNKILQEKTRSLCDVLEGRVDPFDLDVFNPHLQSHVKRAVQRLQFLFGPLLTADRHAILWATRLAVPSASSNPETPLVVALVSSTPRFLPLPLVNQRTNNIDVITASAEVQDSKEGVITAAKQKKHKSKTVDNSSAAAAAVARSGAAAFFGAMSSTWSSSIFGTEK